MENLQYFEGKICTIHTQPVNRNFDDQQHANTFVGIITQIDGLGVWVRLLPEMTRKAFYAASSIIAIIEEVVKPITDEEEKQIKEAFAPEMQLQQGVGSLEQIRNLGRTANKKFHKG